MSAIYVERVEALEAYGTRFCEVCLGLETAEGWMSLDVDPDDFSVTDEIYWYCSWKCLAVEAARIALEM